MTDLEFDPLQFEATPDPDTGKPKNLWQKMAEIQLTMGYIERRGRHPTKHFSYLTITDLREAIGFELSTRNINFCPNMVGAVQVRNIIQKTKNGERNLTETQVTSKFILKDGDSGEEELSEWMGWAEGSDAYAASGAQTNAERRFWESRLMLVTGDVSKKEWTLAQEAENAKTRDEDARVAMERGKASGAKAVGNIPAPLTAKDLADSDKSREEPIERPLDESWRMMPLTMCKLNEHPAYKGKCVGDISLIKLIQANEVFVSNVNNHVDGYTSPGKQHLATAFSNRLRWEIVHGTVLDLGWVDGKYKYEIVEKK